MTTEVHRRVLWFSDLGSADVPIVGGKNASLGEMIGRLAPVGVQVPDGFATTSQAYWEFIDSNGLRDPIARQLDRLRDDPGVLQHVGQSIRGLFDDALFPPAMAQEIARAYRELGRRASRSNLDVAVRSSATAEDLPEASFAGQHESYLNVRGEQALLDACLRCIASLFTDRAIFYRQTNGFDHMRVALSVGIQRMVRSDSGGAGVMFTLDTETGFPDVVLIDAAWGLGETVVRGTVDPDRYIVFKPLLKDESLTPIVSKDLGAKEERLVYAVGTGASTRSVRNPQGKRDGFVLADEEILQLARWGVAIEDHYGMPMDIEWAKDGRSGELFIVQARPETVQAGRVAPQLKTYRMLRTGATLVEGLSVGDAVAVGDVCRLTSPEDIVDFRDGAVLVTEMTDPDWVPIMRRARALVTDRGGRTSHAAIVSRELGLPAVVGTGDAAEVLKEGQEVTVSCAEGDRGFVYDGVADFEEEEIDLEGIAETRTEIMLNLGDPAAAMRWWRLPADGVGLARMEFIVGHHIKVHPMALARPDEVRGRAARRDIARLTRGYEDGATYFVETLAHGIASIAAPSWPDPVIVRMSDFKTNEYAELIGGGEFEPTEANPMLGWRGASRYNDPGYRDGFALECLAIRRVREDIGLTNVIVMIPFCRTLEEADGVIEVLAEHGLARGEHGLELYVMAEIPSNILLADGFAERFDGFSIGSNDLTQLVLGIDRDSERLAAQFDERNPAVMGLIARLIEVAHAHGRKVGLCGQAPSDDPTYARFLVETGIDSISVTPDSFVAVKGSVAESERLSRPDGNIDAVIFDLDGVVTRTADVHARAWKQLFDEYLEGREGVDARPFDLVTDYARYVDGKPRDDGVRDFLASRGIRLPEGSSEDPAGAETVHALGSRKNGYFLEHLRSEGAPAFSSTVRLVRELQRAGIGTAVISSSRNAAEVLQAAGLADLFEVRVDGTRSDALGLRGKPEPDVFLEAARRLGVEPTQAAVVEDALAGVEAGERGGFALVIAVDRSGLGGELTAAGADIVVSDLSELPATALGRRGSPPSPGGEHGERDPEG